MRLFLPFLTLLIFGCLAFSVRAQSTSSDVVYLPNGSQTQWQPYPGLGTNALDGATCVMPGGTQGYSSSYTSAVPSSLPMMLADPSLQAQEEGFDAPLVSTGEGGELYLSHVPTGKRTGFFQKLNFNALWVPKSGGAKGLGMTQLDLSASFAVPMLKPESPLIFTPIFQAWLFDAKTDGYVAKETLYTTGLDIRWIRPLIRNKLTLDLGAAALYSGDFKISGRPSMRYPAHAAMIWNCNPRLKVILGLLYLDRNDAYNWMPMGGIVWMPHEDLNIELVTPRVRIAQRLRWFGSAAGDDKSDWIYTAFEFGGGSWGYEIQGGPGVPNVQGQLDYRDLRALIGYERRTAFGMTLAFEVGYMFDRTIELDRSGNTIHPQNNVFLRLRTSF